MKLKKITLQFICLSMLLILSVGTFVDFTMQLKRALTRETYQTLAEVSTDYNKAFLDRISYNIKTMQVLAGGFEEMEGSSEQEVRRVLQNAVDYGGFSKMAAASADGNSYSNTGTLADVSYRDYFKAAMKGITTISEPLVSSVTGEDAIVIAVPIETQSAVIGVLLGVYPLKTAGTQLLDFTYYSDGYGFVVSPNGKIILSSEHEDKLCDERNLFDFFGKTKLTGMEMSDINAAMNLGKGGNFSYSYEGETRYVSFTPSTVNDWYTFSVASDTMMKQQRAITNKIVYRLLFRLILAGFLIFVWVTLRNKRHNKEILEASEKYLSLLEHINGGMIVAKHARTSGETIVQYVSQGFTDMTGYTLEDINTIYQGRYLDVLLDEDRETAFNIYIEQISAGNSYRMPYRIRKKDGTMLWVMDNGYLVEDNGNLLNHSIVTDISAVKQQEEKLRISEQRFSVAINASSGTLFEVDLKRQLYTHFENAERIFGVSADILLAETAPFAELPYNEFVDAVTTYFFHPDDCAITKSKLEEVLRRGSTSYDARLRRYDGNYIWARVDLSLVTNEFGEPTNLVGFMSDIDAIKKQSELLEGKVQTDSMTGLYNKIAVKTLADKVFINNPHGHHALITLDIDDFKGINDTLGHAFGDLVLMEIANKLKATFRSNDIIGRMGGDEFAILVQNINDKSTVLKKASGLSAALRQTYSGENGNYLISCSIGIVMIEGEGNDFETLSRKADAALYEAKQRGKDQFVLYSEQDAGRYPIASQRTNDEDLEHLKTSHNIEAQIFEMLYTSKDFALSINMALAVIGQRYNVSRVAIFESDNDNLTVSDIYEWCNLGISSQTHRLQNVPISSGSECVMDSFDANGLLYCSDVHELPQYLRGILEGQGVVSTLKVTISNDDHTCGFIGFDDCKNHRAWTSEEIEKLSFLAKVLSVFLFKKKTEEALIDNLHTRLQILDILPDYICVVNPETHSIEYTNGKMQTLLPQAKPGSFCFTTLRGGQNGPCATCLVERIKRGDTNNLEIISEDRKLRLKVNAISINWTKNQKMVLLYGSENQKTHF